MNAERMTAYQKEDHLEAVRLFHSEERAPGGAGQRPPVRGGFLCALRLCVSPVCWSERRRWNGYATFLRRCVACSRRGGRLRACSPGAGGWSAPSPAARYDTASVFNDTPSVSARAA